MATQRVRVEARCFSCVSFEFENPSLFCPISDKPVPVYGLVLTIRKLCPCWVIILQNTEQVCRASSQSRFHLSFHHTREEKTPCLKLKKHTKIKKAQRSTGAQPFNKHNRQRSNFPQPKVHIPKFKSKTNWHRLPTKITLFPPRILL